MRVLGKSKRDAAVCAITEVITYKMLARGKRDLILSILVAPDLDASMCTYTYLLIIESLIISSVGKIEKKKKPKVDRLIF
jgi:hypothetical protein